MPRKTVKTAKPAVKTVSKPVKKSGKLTDAAILEAFTELANAVSSLTEEVRELKGEMEEDNAEDYVPVRRPDGKMMVKEGTKKPEKQTAVAANKPKSVPDIKARYELWAYDEYNQGSIVNSGPKLDKILEAAKKYVTDANVDNALAASEKDKSWEAYFPQVFVDGEESFDVLYAGNKRDGKHYVYVRGEDKWELRKPDASVKFKFYLGQTNSGRNKNDWYLTDQRGKEVSSITDINLERKTVLFVKVV